MDFEMPFRRITTNEVLMFAGSIPAVPTLTGGPLRYASIGGQTA